MAVTIGQDAFGNAIITGDNNQTFVFYGLKELHPELIADIQSGRRRAADIPEAVPLPALTLAIDFEDDTRTQWKIAARRATGVPVERSAAAPWRDDPAFDDALDIFWRLSRVPTERPEDAARLNAAAHRIGDGLALALSRGGDGVSDRGISRRSAAAFAGNRQRRRPHPGAAVGVDPARWPIRRSRRPSRCRPIGAGRKCAGFVQACDTGEPACQHLRPGGKRPRLRTGKLRDRSRIARASRRRDQRDGRSRRPRRRPAARQPAPIGVHFSGHGGPGTLVFEDEYGGAKPVEIGGTPDRNPPAGPRSAAPLLLSRLLSRWRSGRFDGDRHGLPATATALHRDGITQVVAYFGPVLDDLCDPCRAASSTPSWRTDGGRATRFGWPELEMRRAQASTRPQRCRGTPATDGRTARWLLPGHRWCFISGAPISRSGRGIESADNVAIETTERRTERAFPNSRTRVLKAGFVGRRKEMHALRRDLRQGLHRHVVQGTGGLGKSAFCTEALKVYDRLGWQPFAAVVLGRRESRRSGRRVGLANRSRRRCTVWGPMAWDVLAGIRTGRIARRAPAELQRAPAFSVARVSSRHNPATWCSISTISNRCRPDPGRPKAGILPSGGTAIVPTLERAAEDPERVLPAGSRCWPRAATGTPTSARWWRSTACRRTRYGGCCCGFRACGGCRRKAGGDSSRARRTSASGRVSRRADRRCDQALGIRPRPFPPGCLEPEDEQSATHCAGTAGTGRPAFREPALRCVVGSGAGCVLARAARPRRRAAPAGRSRSAFGCWPETLEMRRSAGWSEPGC